MKGWVKELHGYPLLAGHGVWDGVSLEERIEVYRRALYILGANELEVLYRGINTVGYRRKYTSSMDPRADAFKLMFGDLLTKHLQRRCDVRREYALVITDHQAEYAHELRYAHTVTQARRRHGASGFGIVDACHFVDSEHSPIVQLADMAAYVVRRRISVPEERDARREAVMAELAGLVEACVPDPKWTHRSVHLSFGM